MCGISGFSWEDKKLIRAMTKVLSYRGPDDTGHLVTDKISLGHNRLSIVDLSKAGHQPMENDGLWIVFNGEIYNFKEIRTQLVKKGHQFSSGTDTEVILHAYKEWGQDCVTRFNGMWAFAIWDESKKQLFMSRDRFGVKPLYYHYDGKNIIFSSEIKAILEHDIGREMDADAISSFLKHRFIPGDRTILKGIRKLLPGHSMIFHDGTISISRFWQLDWTIESKGERYYEEMLESLLKDAVEKRLMADVPLGAYMSGGLDSSLIVAMNAKLRPDKVKTFTVGFGHESDEFKHARRVAEHIGTDHQEVLLEYSQMTKALPDIVWHMDEPNSDITMFPLYFLSKEARRKVTVVNTGEGADEVFSGYHHFKIGAPLFSLVPGRAKVYSMYYPPFKEKERKALFISDVKDDMALEEYVNATRPKHLLNRILLFDMENELPNWQLTRVDRMTMAHAMEARVPFLDYRIAELAAKMPPHLKQKGISGKHIVKRVARKYLPREIIHRPKQGFTTPRDEWIRKDLKPIAFEMLSRENVARRGIFQPDAVDKIKKDFELHGDRPFRPHAYKLLMLTLLEAWMRIYIDRHNLKSII